MFLGTAAVFTLLPEDMYALGSSLSRSSMLLGTIVSSLVGQAVVSSHSLTKYETLWISLAGTCASVACLLAGVGCGVFHQRADGTAGLLESRLARADQFTVLAHDSKWQQLAGSTPFGGGLAPAAVAVPDPRLHPARPGAHALSDRSPPAASRGSDSSFMAPDLSPLQ